MVKFPAKGIIIHWIYKGRKNNTQLIDSNHPYTEGMYGRGKTFQINTDKYQSLFFSFFPHYPHNYLRWDSADAENGASSDYFAKELSSN